MEEDDWEEYEELSEYDIFSEDDDEYEIIIEPSEKSVRSVLYGFHKDIKKAEEHALETKDFKSLAEEIKETFEMAKEGRMIGSKGEFFCDEVENTEDKYSAKCMWDLNDSGFHINEYKFNRPRERFLTFNNDWNFLMNVDFKCPIDNSRIRYVRPTVVEMDDDSNNIFFAKQDAVLEVEIEGDEFSLDLDFIVRLPEENDE